MASFYPPTGSWFQDLENGALFEVVAIDEKSRTIEVQYYDGDISEFDIEVWGSMRLAHASAPENVYAGYDGAFGNDQELMGESGEYLFSGNLSPIEQIEPDLYQGYDDLF
jgi:hypothetical protein